MQKAVCPAEMRSGRIYQIDSMHPHNSPMPQFTVYIIHAHPLSSPPDFS